ncbi:hypothetical protein C8A00DRAFT_37692 [Chaetomidium leptoderma]|uniref:Uncharacterized protein n=1 Tax=Chaetomidium leptoderma TaxID=669021 RepID=A0AAN6ZUU2_9PEZI|nr:hypothetical protein C8A00DRAFT_37692 [Chaetomidium leptoderma]
MGNQKIAKSPHRACDASGPLPASGGPAQPVHHPAAGRRQGQAGSSVTRLRRTHTGDAGSRSATAVPNATRRRHSGGGLLRVTEPVAAGSVHANAHRQGEEADDFSQLLSHSPSPLATEEIFIIFFIILSIILAILLAV